MYKKHFDKHAHLCPDWQNGEKSPEGWRIKLDAKSGPFESGDFGENDKYRQRAGDIQNVVIIQIRCQCVHFLTYLNKQQMWRNRKKNKKNNLARDWNRCTLRCVS